jgi:hypothetical protein
MSRIALDDLRSAAAGQDKNLNAAVPLPGLTVPACVRKGDTLRVGYEYEITLDG